jgi:hypothetical protein
VHHSHNIDDFRPPYSVEDENNKDEPDYITPAHIDSLTICLDSIHKAFDAFIEMPRSTLRALPTLFFVRNSYAAVALIKMYTAVSAKGSKFGSVFKPKDLKVEYYLDAMIDKMKHAAEGGHSRIATKFTFILGMLKSWQAKRAAGSMGKDQPMLNVKAISAGWEKQQQLGQKSQDAKTASWNPTPAPLNTTTTSKPQHSGLQMLSEVAMGNNNSSQATTTNSTSDPAAAAAAALAATNNPSSTTTPAWDAQLAAYTEIQPQQQQQQQQQLQQQQLQQQQQTTNANLQADGFLQGGYMADIDSFAFTAEELGALGNLMADPDWLTFGLDSGGWAL